MTKPFRPMLASPMEPSLLRFPMLASPKIDGVRCMCIDGKPMSRSMKVIPNRHIQALFAEHAEILEGLDGELVCGKPHAEHPEDNVFNRTVGNVMRHDGEPEFSFWAFDHIDALGTTSPYRVRSKRLMDLFTDEAAPDWLELVPDFFVEEMAHVNQAEAWLVEEGYEGMMLRDPSGPYKQGRSTAREGYLLKVKRHADAEAIIVGFEEEMENTNEATKNEIGRTKRSSAAEGLVGKGRLGAFIVEGMEGQPFAGVRFNVGTGIDHATRSTFWASQGDLLGQAVTYRYLPVGSLDAPRHPVFKGLRHPIDMDNAA
jgi:DNA ligase 1